MIGRDFDLDQSYALNNLFLGKSAQVSYFGLLWLIEKKNWNKFDAGFRLYLYVGLLIIILSTISACSAWNWTTNILTICVQTHNIIIISNVHFMARKLLV